MSLTLHPSPAPPRPPLHFVQLSASELSDAGGVRSSWSALVDEADLVDWSLEETKKLFSETTRKQVRASVCQCCGR